MTMELASCWLKIERAKEHFKILDSEVTAWMKTDPYRIRNQSDEEGRRYSAIADITNPPPLQRWSLITGDCIHNLRAALDHVVYALAVCESRSDPPPDQNLLQFPIADDAEGFNKQRWRIKSLNIGAQTEIERMQPYNLGK